MVKKEDGDKELVNGVGSALVRAVEKYELICERVTFYHTSKLSWQKRTP